MGCRLFGDLKLSDIDAQRVPTFSSVLQCSRHRYRARPPAMQNARQHRRTFGIRYFQMASSAMPSEKFTDPQGRAPQLGRAPKSLPAVLTSSRYPGRCR